MFGLFKKRYKFNRNNAEVPPLVDESITWLEANGMFLIFRLIVNRNVFHFDSLASPIFVGDLGIIFRYFCCSINRDWYFDTSHPAILPSCALQRNSSA
jgi:hypothetical protein